MRKLFYGINNTLSSCLANWHWVNCWCLFSAESYNQLSYSESCHEQLFKGKTKVTQIDETVNPLSSAGKSESYHTELWRRCILTCYYKLENF